MHTTGDNSEHIAYFSDDGETGVTVTQDEADDLLLSSGFIPFDTVATNANATNLAELFAMLESGSFLGDLHTTDFIPPNEFLRGTFQAA